MTLINVSWNNTQAGVRCRRTTVFAVLFVLACLSLLPSEATGQNVAFEHDKWERSKDAIVVSDMSVVTPQSALSRDVRRVRQWKVLEYETKGGLKGKCIASLPDTGAPAVTLPLDLKGWYAIYVGLGGMGRFAFGQESEARLKLTNDVAYQHRRYTGARDDIDEVFFKAADLTGQDLHIAQMRMQAKMDLMPDVKPRHTVIMYVKLVPLTDGEVNWIQKDRQDKSKKNLIATLDAFSWIHQNYPTTKEEFLEDFEHYRDSDFGTLSWQIIGGDLVNFPSKYGTIPGELSEVPARTGDGYVTKSIKQFIERGEEHTKLAVQAARSMNKRIFIGFRAQAFQATPAFEDYFTSKFYREHPEYRAYDRDGTPAMRLSYAVPQVREHLLRILKEALAYQPDGLEIIYFRGLPLMLWEDAFSDQFRKKYGADAKQVAEDDPRLYELRGEIMTGFMRDVRKLLDDVQKEQGRAQRYELMASVVHNENDNRKFGLDVERWVNERLIDKISIFPAAFHTDTSKPVDMAWFKKITAGTKVEVYPLMIGWRMSSYEEAIANARKYYDDGAAGLLFWDPFPTGTYTPRPPQPQRHYQRAIGTYWSLVSRLGHRERLAEWEKEKRPAMTYVPLKRYGDHYFGRWVGDVGF
ncbi:MAG: hypothetical protein AB7L70_18320 [Pyrinomonadaceae bacterium]